MTTTIPQNDDDRGAGLGVEAPSPPIVQLRNVAVLTTVASAGAFVGASAAVWKVAIPAEGVFRAALARSAPTMAILAVVGLVAAFAVSFRALRPLRVRAALAGRWLRRRSWIVHLVWLPVIALVVFAEGPVLLVALALPAIVYGLFAMARMIGDQAERLDVWEIAVAAALGLALGYFVVP